MPRLSPARNAALETAERLFRTQGYAATGLTQILDESGSPKGSFYFHFPNGKDGMAAEVIERYGARGRALIEHLSGRAKGDAPGFVHALCDAFEHEMTRSEFRLGCAIQNLAAEKAPGDPVLSQALDDAMTDWIDAIARHFAGCGLGPAEARRRALGLIAALEGARTLARIQRDGTVFRAVRSAFAAD